MAQKSPLILFCHVRFIGDCIKLIINISLIVLYQRNLIKTMYLRLIYSVNVDLVKANVINYTQTYIIRSQKDWCEVTVRFFFVFLSITINVQTFVSFFNLNSQDTLKKHLIYRIKNINPRLKAMMSRPLVQLGQARLTQLRIFPTFCNHTFKLDIQSLTDLYLHNNYKKQKIDSLR